MKKPKRRRTAPRRKQIRMPRLPEASVVSASETRAGEMLAGMIRARLALMPAHVAEEYRTLAQRDDLTVAERAKVSVLEDTFSPSRQQLQVAIAAIQAEYELKSRGSPAADWAAQRQIVTDMIRETLNREELAGFNAAAKEADAPVLRGRSDPGVTFERLLRLYLPRVDRDRLDTALHENGVSERQIMARYPTGAGRRHAA